MPSMKMLSIALGVLIAQLSWAGVMEISGSFGLRNSSMDEDNYTKNESWTGSFAWYFMEQSAIELSYTKGRATQSMKAQGDPNALVYYADFEMYGADLVFTLGKKTSFVQPYVRGGAAQLKKKMYRKDTTDNSIKEYGEPIDQTVPSYGAGIKIMLTETFSLKGSYDRWKSGSDNETDKWDDAIKAGVSWFF